MGLVVFPFRLMSTLLKHYVMEKLQWFKFSYADWRMGKIQRCPEITQARFMNLCCLYWSKEAELTIEDAEIEIDKEHLDILIAKKVIEEDGKYVFIKFLDEQLDKITETSKDKSKAAKVRWDKYRKDKAAKELESTTIAESMHVHTDALQTSAEKRREEERREDKYPFDLFWKKYPKKVAKDKCKTSFNRLSLTEKKAIFDTLDNFLKFKPFKDYTHPNPSTYLNQKRWEDEVEEVKPMKIEHNGVMRDVAFYKDDGTPVFKGTTAPTLQQIQEASS